MKNWLFYLLCFFVSSSLTGQQRLTNFALNGSNVDHYLTEYNGVNYLLTVDQNNTLEVFKLLNENTKIFLHSRYFQGLYDNDYDIEIKNNFIVLPSESEIIDYNFVQDVVHSAAIPEGFYFSAFSGLINSTENRFLVSLKTLDQSTFIGIVYEIGGKIYDLNGPTSFRLYGDDTFTTRYNSSGIRNCYFKNFITNQVDTVAYDVQFGQYPAQGHEGVYYFDSDGQVYLFDQTVRSSSPQTGVKLDNVLNYNSILISDDHLVLVSSTSENATIKIYNSESLELENTYQFVIDYPIFASQSSINKGVFTALIDRELLIVDLSTGQHLIRPTYYFWPSKFKVLDDRYIINPYEVIVDRQSHAEFELIDIQNLEVSSINGEFNVATTYNVGFAKFDQNYLAAYTYYGRYQSPLFNVSVQDPSVERNTLLDNTNYGLPDYSQILKVEDNIYLLEPGISKVVGNSVESISPSDEIDYVKYSFAKIKEDHIFFVQKEPNIIYSYDGSTLKEEADLTGFDGFNSYNYLVDYIVSDDFVLFYSRYYQFYRYDKSTKEITLFDNHEISYSTHLFGFENKIYFTHDSNLYTTDGYEPKLILDNYKNVSSSETGGIIVFKDQLLVLTHNGLVRIERNDSVTLIGTQFNSELNNEILVDETENNLVIGSETKKIHYDGDSVYELELEFGNSYGGRVSFDNYFFFREYSDSDWVFSFFNSITKEYGKFPAELRNYYFLDYFESSGDYFILMRSGFNPYDKMYIYKTDSTFNHIELVNVYLDAGWFSRHSYTKSNDSGFLYAGNLLFLINEENEFIHLDRVQGTNFTTGVVEDNGDFYFLGSDSKLGKQLYKTSLNSFTEHCENNELEDEYKIYPNPSSDRITIENYDRSYFKSKQYFIYSMNGKLIESGSTSGLLNITSLPAGSYVLKLQEGDSFAKNIFIKH